MERYLLDSEVVKYFCQVLIPQGTIAKNFNIQRIYFIKILIGYDSFNECHQ
ncbi:hypothetical protein DYBT9275_02242 [Dyadobacter sp. CECT 9275]|uniref:Uncharacterized protein n=1 Tax=Dyadobacter helix TaxID=2822344 RepID=A0A916JB97_9BACT|nr:hypothetical protein DYBT9275_02242 [Dyadobacter sp. CECT 9275]